MVVEACGIMRDRMTILIVENNHFIRGAYRNLFELDGSSVVEASNGAEALIWCRRQTAEIILLDLEMPVLDGWGFLEYRLRQPKMREIPVLVVTRQPDTVELRRALSRLGADGLLQKPVHPDDLINAVESLLTTPAIPAVPHLEADSEGGNRRDPRVVFSIPICVRLCSSLDTSGMLRDLSPGGLGASLPCQLRPGEKIAVSLPIQGRSIRLTGVVRWAGESFTDGGNRHGVRFTERQEDPFPLHVYSFFHRHLEVTNGGSTGSGRTAVGER